MIMLANDLCLADQNPLKLLAPPKFTRTLTSVFLFLFCVLYFSSLALAEQKDFELSVGDVLTFDILDDADPAASITIGGDGQAQFPMIGSITVAGRTLADAVDAVRKEYREREILVDPKVSIAIASFRPLFVLGEVRNPGSYPFSLGMTVEQAIGLAGGVQTSTLNPSDRIVVQARLRSDIEAAKMGAVREAVYAARLVAQLAGRDQINLDDAPKVAAPFLKDAPYQVALEIEQRILNTDLANFNTQVKLLTDGIAEAQKGLKLLDELVVKQQEVLKITQEDLARINSLRARGLNTESEVSRGELAESSQTSRLLEFYSEISRSRREFGSLQLELAKLKAEREKDLLQQLQERQTAVEQFAATRQSLEQQLGLMVAAAADEKTQEEKDALSYTVRRIKDGVASTMAATPLMELAPGDTVIVALANM